MFREQFKVYPQAPVSSQILRLWPLERGSRMRLKDGASHHFGADPPAGGVVGMEKTPISTETSGPRRGAAARRPVPGRRPHHDQLTRAFPPPESGGSASGGLEVNGGAHDPLCESWGLFPCTARKKRQSRPISRVLSWTVIPLGASSPIRSSSLPGDIAGHDIVSLFGLAPGGVCRAGPLPDSRCALTAPFHPCRPARAVLGGIFLLHFPSARAAQALPGTVPCGARTFLGAPERTTRLSGRLCRDGLSHGRPGGACREALRACGKTPEAAS